MGSGVKRMKRTGALERVLGATLAISLAVTMGVMAAQGRGREAIPLHLCGLSALSALAVAFGARGALLDFLWYIGLPGALLALIFPAPAISRWQIVLNLSYAVTHALIVLIPLAAMKRGGRPRPDGAPVTLIALQLAALAAFAVNRALGTDFMFLCAPPAGTPLEAVFTWGYLPYLCALDGMMLVCCLIMGALLRMGTAHAQMPSDRRTEKPCRNGPDAL